jgi:phenylacetate-CoA ligase
VSSFDLTQLLHDLPLRRWSVHQRTDAAVIVSIEPESGSAPQLDARITEAVVALLGQVRVMIEPLTAPDKVVPFTVETPA